MIELLNEKVEFKEIIQKVQPYLSEDENFHDAYYDSKLTIALFWYLLKKLD
ncbi:hypothetical protein IJ913_01780 [bacterium]|nr:hypothetical protein [bacterium]